MPGWPITIRGGGDPSRNTVIEPFVRMGPPPRSLAAEANDCFMVRPQHGANRIQGCNAKSRVPTAGCPRVIQTAQQAGGRDGDPNLIKRCAVLATVNIASRRRGANCAQVRVVWVFLGRPLLGLGQPGAEAG